ncbi:MAG: hypothetical protein VX764_03695 [Planctomycetota bacterium]|nr:hypothetical protein [Planctomycetota bacterium]
MSFRLYPVLLVLLLSSSLDAGEPIETAFVNSGITVVGGELGAVADLINPFIQTSVIDAGIRNLLEIQFLDDPTMQNDPEIEVASFPGIDVDGNPDNDFDGSNLYQVDPIGLNDEGDPITIFTPGSITDGIIVAGPADLDLGGGLVIPGAIIEGTIAPGGTSLDSAVISAAVPVAIFDAIPAPAPFDGFPFNYDTMTEVLAFLGVDPDVDLDGDGTVDAYSVDFVLSFVSCQIIYPVTEPSFQRGDINLDGTLDLGDAISLLGYLFIGGETPGCLDSADTNDDGTTDIGDAVQLLSHLFTGGVAPAEPFEECGVDPTDDPLTCETTPPGC